MSNELMELQQELAPAKYADDATFSNLAQGAGFLPRLALFGASNNETKAGLIGMGHWGLVRSKDQIEDLGPSCDVLVLGWRPRALRFGGEDSLLSVFNPADPKFKRIELESAEDDSGCVFGPEFLVYCPTSQPPCFATAHFNSKTARREAPQVKALIGKASTFKAQLIKGKKYSWHGPVITQCSTPFQIPALTEIREVLEKFNNPPEPKILSAPVDTNQRDR